VGGDVLVSVAVMEGDKVIVALLVDVGTNVRVCVDGNVPV